MRINVRRFLIPLLLLVFTSTTAMAQDETTIDISGNNNDKNYKSYNTAISLPANKTLKVKMARYCYFSSKITGSGLLKLYSGGERSYLGTAKGAAWADWSNYKGDVHIYADTANAPGAGYYAVVLAHGGKFFSPENVEEAIKNTRVNRAMENNRVTLHKGATMLTEANQNGSGFRIGELNTEAGSVLQGYMKDNRAVHYLLGCMNTDATLAGTITPNGKKKAWYAVRSALRHRVIQQQQASVQTLTNDARDVRPFVYDLSGRMLSGETLRPGLYVVNGKKVIK